MKTHFAFGKNGIDVEVPDDFDCQVVRSRAAQALENVAGALEAALDHPIQSESLEKLAAGRRTAAISVCVSVWYHQNSPDDDPSIIVSNAFNGGGPANALINTFITTTSFKTT